MANYRLQEGSVQHNFHNSKAKVQIFGGGFANGKTTALAIKALKIAKDYPGSNGLLARATYPKLNDTLRKVVLKWCPSNWILRKPTQDDNSLYLRNGTVINFRYIAQRGKLQADGTSTSNLLSATYDWIGVDQIEDPEIVHKDFLDLLGRLRGDTPYQSEEDDETMPSTGPRWLMITCNPTSGWVHRELVKPLHNWLKTGYRSEKLLIDEDNGQPIVELFESDTYANKANLAPDYLRSLETAYKGQQKERYLEGKWAAFEGLVYSTYDKAIHTVTREFAENYLAQCLMRHVIVKGIESYDFGLVSPSCYLLGFIDDFGRVIVIDGYYVPEFSYDLQPMRIMEKRYKYLGAIKFTERPRADPAIFKRVMVAGMKETGETIANLYQQAGIPMKPASNDIKSGISKVSSYLNGRLDIPHIVTGERLGPLIYFVDDLDFIDTEITSYYWQKDTQGNTLDMPNDINDHAMDAIKYMLAEQPDPSKIVVPSQLKQKPWMLWQEEDISV